MKKTLENYREEIDKIDEDLLNVLAKRFIVVREVGKLKKEKNIQPLDEKRWKIVLEKVKAKAKKYFLSEKFIEKIYEEIHQEALRIEKENE